MEGTIRVSERFHLHKLKKDIGEMKETHDESRDIARSILWNEEINMKVHISNSIAVARKVYAILRKRSAGAAWCNLLARTSQSLSSTVSRHQTMLSIDVNMFERLSESETSDIIFKFERIKSTDSEELLTEVYQLRRHIYELITSMKDLNERFKQYSSMLIDRRKR